MGWVAFVPVNIHIEEELCCMELQVALVISNKNKVPLSGVELEASSLNKFLNASE